MIYLGMITPDFVNGLFEGAGALFVAKNIHTLYKDKVVKGVSKLTMVFFASWGYFNIFYYWFLCQPFSWWCGVCLCIANTIWVCQIIYYHRRKVLTISH